MRKAQPITKFSKFLKLFRRPEAQHGVMVGCRLQILTHCDHVHVMRPQVFQYLLNLIECFAKAQHDARFSRDIRMLCLEMP